VKRRRRRFTDEPDAGGGSSSAAPAPQRRKFTEGAADEPAAWGADGGLLSAEDWGKLASTVEDTQEEETRTKFEQEQTEVSEWGRTYKAGCAPPAPPLTSSQPAVRLSLRRMRPLLLRESRIRPLAERVTHASTLVARTTASQHAQPLTLPPSCRQRMGKS